MMTDRSDDSGQSRRLDDIIRASGRAHLQLPFRTVPEVYG